MITWSSLRNVASVMALVFLAAALQGCPLKVKLEDECRPGTGGGGPQGSCYSHRFGSWGTDHQNFPTCTGGYVCNNPGTACVDTATGNSGACQLNPNSGTCDCKCM
jgi:hypothetical protein